MDLMESIRQMMADANYSGAEQALELALISASKSQRIELIPLYFDCLLLQSRSLPVHLLLEVLNPLWENSPELAIRYFELASSQLVTSKDFRVLRFRMKLAEKRGRIQELHGLVSAYQLHLYERVLPAVPGEITALVQKYFRTDFHLSLQSFALTLLRRDYTSAEEQVRHLILDAFERSTPKAKKEKLIALLEVIRAQIEKGPFDIYLSLLQLYLHGIQEKKDYKRLAEVLIYFVDFRFNVMGLQILESIGAPELAQDLASDLQTHPSYDFVYVAKYFPGLKKYFVRITEDPTAVFSWETPDLTLEGAVPKSKENFEPVANSEDEILLIQLVRQQDYSPEALLELAVSFLQSELPRVAAAVALSVHKEAQTPAQKLKAAYLVLTSYLLSGDYRRTIDLALESMELVSTTDDLLSFLYCEAEAYARLGMVSEARQVLRRIVSIDAGYRMARERLEKLG